MIGLKRGIVKLVPYNRQWKEIFKKEERILKKTLGKKASDIQHIGSTVIPGVPAKPIIDIAVAVPSLNVQKLEGITPLLKKVGYQYRKKEDKHQYLFVKGGEENRMYYLHMMKSDSKAWEDHILFRDYLRNHKKMAHEYAKLKRKLANKFPNDRGSYTAGKEKFINEVVEKAKVIRD